jgi:hypothetical protein
MPYDTDTTGRSRLSPGLTTAEFDRTDRVLLGSCAGIWLVALGAGVAATVALVDLGTGRPASSGDSETPWLLYSVIGISAVVIVGAVPLLLRARREAAAEAAPRLESRAAPEHGRPAARQVEAPTQKFRAPATPVGVTASAPVSPLTAAADQLWLRCAVVIACAIGVAMVAIGVGTYLMAVGSTAAAWVFFVLCGLVTVAMPAAPWYFLRELRALQNKQDA